MIVGGPGLLAGRQIEERSDRELAETKDAELAVELIRAAALDERRGLGRRGGVRRVDGKVSQSRTGSGPLAARAASSAERPRL